MSKKCPGCGCIMEDSAKYCDECGELLGDSSASPYDGDPEISKINMYSDKYHTAGAIKTTKKSAKGKWFAVIVFCMLLLVFIIIIFSSNGSSCSSKDMSRTEESADQDTGEIQDNLTEPEDLKESASAENSVPLQNRTEDIDHTFDESGEITEEKEVVGTESEGTIVEDHFKYDECTGEYIRSSGPCSYLSVWMINETGVDFAAGIGSSGYLAYRDLRDCTAEWINDTTAVYDNEYGETIEFIFDNNGSIKVEERGIDSNIMLSLSGIYVSSEEVDLDDFGFVLADSDSRYITENDLIDLSLIECKIARNEIYARHGRIFNDEQLQNYFDSCTWYRGEISAESFNLDVLNNFEKENVKIIAEYEEKMGYK